MAGDTLEGKARTLILIGGGKDRMGRKDILTEVVRRVDGGPLVVAPFGTRSPRETGEEYRRLFRELGATHVSTLIVQNRSQAHDSERVEVLRNASGAFIPGPVENNGPDRRFSALS